MKKIIKITAFAFLCLLCFFAFISEPDMKLSGMDIILYKAYISMLLLAVTIGLGLHIKRHRNMKFWIITVSIGFLLSAVPYSLLSSHAKLEIKKSNEMHKEQHEEVNSKIIPKETSEFLEDENTEQYSIFESELIEESGKPTETAQNESEIMVTANFEKEENEKELLPEMEAEKEELGEEPVRFIFDDEYIVGNILLHISEIQVRQSVFKVGSHILEFRIFCELTNLSSSDQFFTATKTGNVVGVFYGQEETRIGGMENLLWDKEDYNISTGTTIPAGETKELVVQAGSIITDTITYGDALEFDIFFRNNDEIFTVSFDCQTH